MSAIKCKLCQTEGEFSTPGDQPKCAFPEGVFVDDNWMCRTTRALRHIIEQHQDEDRPHEVMLPRKFYCDDQWLGVIPLRDGVDWQNFLVLSWYKNRGRTEGAWMIGEENCKPLTEDVALRVINRYLPEVGQEVAGTERNYNGLLCSVCGEPQFNTPSGDVCKKGHGGAPGVASVS